jgi:hypothetical protein
MKSELLAQHNKYAWVIAWPLILLAALASCTQSFSSGSTASDSAEKNAVQGFGQKAITAYVSASAVDTAAVTVIYGPLVAAPSDGTGFPFPAETVLGVIGAGDPDLVATRADKSQVWNVRVDVLTVRGEQRWLQQIVAIPGGSFQVEGLPGKIPGAKIVVPPAPDEQGHGLTKVDAGSPIYTTVADFFDAWLTGKGDLSRLAGDSVDAFSEPPYSKVSIDSVNASREPDKVAGSVNASVSVIAEKIASEKISYNLTLTAVGGRWVVTDVAAAAAAAN